MKYAFIFIAILFIASGVIAQQNLDDPFQSYDMPSFQGGTATEDSATVGTQIPYFVDPDPVINSLSGYYDTSETNVTNGISTEFTWSLDNVSGLSWGTPLNYPAASGSVAPYVVVQMPGSATGTNDADTLEVVEENPAVSGCPGPTRKVPIRVFAEPSFDMSDDDVSDTIEVCSGSVVNLPIYNVADNGIDKYGNVNFLMDTTVTEVDAQDYSSELGSVESGTDIVRTRAESDALTGGNYNLYPGGITLTAQDSDDGDSNAGVTKYVYTFKGMNDHISRKSDFYKLGSGNRGSTTPLDFTFYGPDNVNDNSLVYIVFPAPNTGDIYHVPNDFNL